MFENKKKIMLRRTAVMVSNSRLLALEQLDRICPWFSIIMILPSGQGPLKEIHVTNDDDFYFVKKCFWQTKISHLLGLLAFNCAYITMSKHFI
jgi:hypothetical protein